MGSNCYGAITGVDWEESTYCLNSCFYIDLRCKHACRVQNLVSKTNFFKYNYIRFRYEVEEIGENFFTPKRRNSCNLNFERWEGESIRGKRFSLLSSTSVFG